jgi:hypothetical protein
MTTTNQPQESNLTAPIAEEDPERFLVIEEFFSELDANFGCYVTSDKYGNAERFSTGFLMHKDTVYLATEFFDDDVLGLPRLINLPRLDGPAGDVVKVSQVAGRHRVRTFNAVALHKVDENMLAAWLDECRAFAVLAEVARGHFRADLVGLLLNAESLRRP